MTRSGLSADPFPRRRTPVNRRNFLQLGAASLGWVALRPATRLYAAESTRRAGLIGTGCYGKSVLFRLLQVAPVEVVSLCADNRLKSQNG